MWLEQQKGSVVKWRDMGRRARQNFYIFHESDFTLGLKPLTDSRHNLFEQQQKNIDSEEDDNGTFQLIKGSFW